MFQCVKWRFSISVFFFYLIPDHVDQLKESLVTLGECLRFNPSGNKLGEGAQLGSLASKNQNWISFDGRVFKCCKTKTKSAHWPLNQLTRSKYKLLTQSAGKRVRMSHANLIGFGLSSNLIATWRGIFGFLFKSVVYSSAAQPILFNTQVKKPLLWISRKAPEPLHRHY